jgi:hypothetical protein
MGREGGSDHRRGVVDAPVPERHAARHRALGRHSRRPRSA